MKIYTRSYTCIVSAVMLLTACFQAAAMAQDTKEAEDWGQRVQQQVSFPARFSGAEFFDLIAQPMRARFITPDLEPNSLTQLNQALGNRRVAVQEALETYAKVTKYEPGGQLGNLLIVSAPPRLSSRASAEMKASLEASASALRFLLSLSEKQVDSMYLEGQVEGDELSPNQRVLYVDFIKKSRIFDPEIYAGQANPPVSKLSSEEILKLPIRYFFSYTASFRAVNPSPKANDVDAGATDWLGVYDYGRGLVRNLRDVDEGNTKTASYPLWKEPNLFSHAYYTDEPFTSPHQKVKFFLVADQSPQEVTVQKTQTLPLQDVANLIEKATGKKAVVDQAMPKIALLLTKGQYSAKDLLTAVSSASSTQLRTVGNSIFITESSQPNMQGQLSKVLGDSLEKAKAHLKRLPFGSASVIPFSPAAFGQGSTVSFTKLEPSQQVFIEERLKNENIAGIGNFNLRASNIQFADALWFQGVYGKQGALTSFDYRIW